MTINGVRPDFTGSIACRSARIGLCTALTYSMMTCEYAVIGCMFVHLVKVGLNTGVSDSISKLTIERDALLLELANYTASIVTASVSVIALLVGNLDKATQRLGKVTERSSSNSSR